MPSAGFQQLIERVITDEAFAARLQTQTEHEAVLSEYDLSEDERTALLSGEPGQLAALGLDERISKKYGYSPAS